MSFSKCFSVFIIWSIISYKLGAPCFPIPMPLNGIGIAYILIYAYQYKAHANAQSCLLIIFEH